MHVRVNHSCTLVNFAFTFVVLYYCNFHITKLMKFGVTLDLKKCLSTDWECLDSRNLVVSITKSIGDVVPQRAVQG